MNIFIMPEKIVEDRTEYNVIIKTYDTEIKIMAYNEESARKIKKAIQENSNFISTKKI